MSEASQALVIRRALGTARDTRTVASLFEIANLRAGPSLQKWLSSDADGVVLIAERGGRAVGLAALRFLRVVGGDEVDAALLDAVFVSADSRRRGVGRALVEAARGEAEARESRRFKLLADASGEAARAFAAALGLGALDATVEAPSSEAQPVSAAPSIEAPRPSIELELAPSITVRFAPDAPKIECVARWSGAQAVRTRWRSDLTAATWSIDDLAGTGDEDGDAMRFDATTGALRETWFNRPTALLFDDALLATLSALPDVEGALTLADTARRFALPPTDFALFDVSLACLVALRSDAVEALASGAEALAVNLGGAVSALFIGGRYAGWRAREPVLIARPMGWPETREPRALNELERAALTSLLYDWMVIDASPRIDPADATDPEEIAHMVSLRERARALSEIDGEVHACDAVPGVARDVAAQILWGWGFFKVGA